jgi:hypothetical protein
MKVQTRLRSRVLSPEAQLLDLLQSNHIDTGRLAALLQGLDPGQVQALMAQLDPQQRARLVQFFITPQLAGAVNTASFGQSG